MLNFIKRTRTHDAQKAVLDRYALEYIARETALGNALKDPMNNLEYVLTQINRGHRSATGRSIDLSWVAAPINVLVAPLRAIAAILGAVPAPVISGRTGGWFGTALRGTGMLMATAVVASAATVGVLWPQVGPDMDTVLNNIACTQAHVLVDVDGYAGALPLETCTNRLTLAADFGDQINFGIGDAWTLLEGGLYKDDLTLGQDVKGIARYLASVIPGAQAAAEAVNLPFTRGGSSGFQTLIEASYGSPHALSFLEKPRMMVLGMRMSVAAFKKDTDRAALLAKMPVIAGYGGIPLGGRHAAQIMFKGPPAEVWQQCLFASAIGKNLLLSTGPALEDGKIERNKKVKARASVCISKSFTDATEAEAQLKKLDAWVIPQVPKPEGLDPAIRRHTREEMRLVGNDDRPQTIKLTASRKAQAILMGAGDIEKGTGAMQPIANALPTNSCMIEGQCAQPVGFAFVAADIQGGRLVPTAVRTNTSGAVYGAVVEIEDSFVRASPQLGQASLSKILHLLVAADNNVQSLCSKKRNGLKDEGGYEGIDNCDDAFGPPERLAVATAIKWSRNLGFAHLVERFPEDFEALHTKLGWLGEMTVEGTIGATLGLGTQPAGPADIMQLIAAIETGRSGPLGMSDIDRPEGNGKMLDLGKMGFDEGELRRVRFWLNEPITGTLNGTVKAINWPKQCDRPHMGKTGTNYEHPKRLSKNLVLIVKCQHRTIVLYGGVWTRDLANGSIGKVTHASMAPMIEAALRAALANTL